MVLSWPSAAHLCVIAVLLLRPAISEAQRADALASPSLDAETAVTLRGADGPLVGALAEPWLVENTVVENAAAPNTAVENAAAPNTSSTSPEPASGPSSDDWTVDVTAVMSLPLSVGLEAQVRMPLGIMGFFSAGHTPSAFLDMMRAILDGQSVYSESIEPMIQDSISDGVWNVRVGVGYAHPLGFELSLAYTGLFGATNVRLTSLESALGQRLPWGGMTEVPLSMSLHAISARVGWRFLIEEDFVIAAALGWTHTIGAEVGLDVSDEIRALSGDPAGEVESAMISGMEEFGFAPELIVSAGYRF